MGTGAVRGPGSWDVSDFAWGVWGGRQITAKQSFGISSSTVFVRETLEK